MKVKNWAQSIMGDGDHDALEAVMANVVRIIEAEQRERDAGKADESAKWHRGQWDKHGGNHWHNSMITAEAIAKAIRDE